MPAQIILAFANDKDGSLKCLQHENDMVYGYLNRMDNTLVNPVSKPDVKLSELFDEFAARKDDIRIFHFSGHAGQMDLLFSDEKRVSGEGIAQLMAYAPNIELVFLNGCATADLIDAFHAAGVKRVIATARKVFDDEAADFSIKFYSSLSQFSNIGDAFDYARAYVVADKKTEAKDPANERHISTTSTRTTNGSDFPYGIFYKPQLKEDQGINNTLSDYDKLDEWKFDFTDLEQPEVAYNPCIELLKCIGKKGLVLVKFLKQNSPEETDEARQFGDLHNKYSDFIKRTQDIYHAKDLSDKIINLLPRPLGIIMRQMTATANDIGKNANSYKELLKYQLHFYDVLLKISCFTMLSDLYEVIQKRKKDGKVPYFDSQTYQDIIKLLTLQEKDTLEYNYRELIRQMRQQIIANEEIPFVGEYMAATQSADNYNLEMAHEIIKIKKIQFASNKLRGGWINHCKAVEDELCNILEEVYFIMRYNLLVIRNVEAIRWRFKKDRTYDHRITLLRYSNDLERHIIEDDCTENYSVILVKGLNRIVDFLSLMPFVIDKCVLDEGSSQLFYYSYCKNNVLVYEGVEDSRETMEIEICDGVEDVMDENANLVAVPVKYVPYAEKLIKDLKLDKAKVNLQLREIYEQFDFFKKEMRELTYKIKKQ